MLRYALMVGLISMPIWHYVFDSYSIERYPPLPMGKYEEIVVGADIYERWYAVTPPHYAKIFISKTDY
jgi:hypothetical protein